MTNLYRTSSKMQARNWWDSARRLLTIGLNWAVMFFCCSTFPDKTGSFKGPYYSSSYPFRYHRNGHLNSFDNTYSNIFRQSPLESLLQNILEWHGLYDSIYCMEHMQRYWMIKQLLCLKMSHWEWNIKHTEFLHSTLFTPLYSQCDARLWSAYRIFAILCIGASYFPASRNGKPSYAIIFYLVPHHPLPHQQTA